MTLAQALDALQAAASACQAAGRASERFSVSVATLWGTQLSSVAVVLTGVTLVDGVIVLEAHDGEERTIQNGSSN